MDQQSTDPNNPNPTPPAQPVNPVPVADPAVTPSVAPAPTTSMWGGGQSDVSVNPAIPIVPTPIIEPVPTFIPPASPIEPPPLIPTTPNFGENPGSAPIPVPVSVPVPDVSAVPSWAPTNENSEAVPTDLSNLMGNNPPTSAETAQPTVVVPPSGSETNQVVTSGSKGLPKIVLIIGIVLILIVIGASAYFILGVGNSSNLPTSIPAEQQSLTNPPKQIVPTVVPVETGTGSATLGNPNGILSGTPTPATSSGTSAIDVLRSRITPTPVQ